MFDFSLMAFVLSMKSIKTKIKFSLLELIKAGKKHEFRLNTPDRRNLSIRDQITLVSNENHKDNIVVTITDISTHSNWIDA